MVSRPAPARAPAPPARGFTFIELIVVMGVLASLMGLAVGYLKSAGRVNALAMARNQVLDAARRAQALGRGDKISMITFRRGLDENGRPADEVFTSLAEGVLTHAFETLDGASRSLPVKSAGSVKIVPGGRTGNCAQFSRGAPLEFEPQPSFAVTDGLDCEMWLMPDAGSNVMTLVEGQGAYELALVRGTAATGEYDVRLKLNLRPVDEQGEPVWTTFDTEGAPVKATGRWTHVHVRYDGLSTSFEVDGLDFLRKSTAAAASGGRGAGARRVAVPPEGAVAVTLSSASQPYTGKMDAFVLRGVFRLKEDRTLLPDGVEIEVLAPAKQGLPFRVTYRNGSLDPERHADDVKIAFRDVRHPGDWPLVLVLGRHGAIRADYNPSSGAVAPTQPAGAAPAVTPGPERGR